jgi:hypothetical protein
MWAEEIVGGGKTAAAHIQSVAELIDSYVEKLLAPAAEGNAVHLSNLRLDLVAIAVQELGRELTPGWLTRTQVIDVLPESTDDNAEERIGREARIAMLLNSRLLEEDSRNPELMRIALDPIAEHLVARDRVEALAGNAKRWQLFLDRLEKLGWPAGFVGALTECLQARGYGHSKLPVSDAVRKRLLEAIRNRPAASHDSQPIPSASLAPA